MAAAAAGWLFKLSTSEAEAAEEEGDPPIKKKKSFKQEYHVIVKHPLSMQNLKYKDPHPPV